MICSLFFSFALVVCFLFLSLILELVLWCWCCSSVLFLVIILVLVLWPLILLLEFFWLVRDNVMCVLRRCPCRVCSLFLFVVIETGLCDWYRSLWWCVLWFSISRLWVCFLFLFLISESVLCSWGCSLVLSFGVYYCPCSLFFDFVSWTFCVWSLILLVVLLHRQVCACSLPPVCALFLFFVLEFVFCAWYCWVWWFVLCSLFLRVLFVSCFCSLELKAVLCYWCLFFGCVFVVIIVLVLWTLILILELVLFGPWYC